MTATFTVEQFNQLLDMVLDQGVEVTMKKVDGLTWYDLNTQMKSNLMLRFEAGNVLYKGRYKEGQMDLLYTVETAYNELLGLVSACMCGRDFGNQAWVEVLNA